MPKSEKLLMVFIKNPELGKVKTRLAKEIGEEKALSVYFQLLFHTNFISILSTGDKAVFYSDEIDEGDMWLEKVFQKYVQEGKDLGERMLNAFRRVFARGYKKVVLIGSDCIELNEFIINEAFDALDKNDVVFGPAKDGGYYLVGMNQLVPELFQNKQWSTSDVLLDSILDIKKLGLKHQLLKTLSDIDTLEDLQASGLRV